MELPVYVHPRVAQRHPNLTERDVLHAWDNAVAASVRRLDYDAHVKVGFDANGRMLECIGVLTDEGDWLIYHAMTPPSAKTMREVGLERR